MQLLKLEKDPAGDLYLLVTENNGRTACLSLNYRDDSWTHKTLLNAFIEQNECVVKCDVTGFDVPNLTGEQPRPSIHLANVEAS